MRVQAAWNVGCVVKKSDKDGWTQNAAALGRR